MLKVVSTSLITGEDVVDEMSVIHPSVYTIHCEDDTGNKLDVETNKQTFVQITNFLDKLRST
jgi:hypothetical protein